MRLFTFSCNITIKPYKVFLLYRGSFRFVDLENDIVW